MGGRGLILRPRVILLRHMKQTPASLTRRAVLTGLLAGAATPVLANAPTRSLFPVLRPGSRHLAPSAGPLIDAARLSGTISYVVADAASGEILEARDRDMLLPPASVAKAATSLFALDRLGPGFRFRTRLRATGPVESGWLEGDLILVGSGDPTLDTNRLGELAAGLKAAGVREIRGAFRVDASVLPSIWEIDPGQPDHVGYNPGLSGLNLNFNRVHFEWKRTSGGYDVAMDARTDQYRPRVATARMRVVDRTAPVYTYSSKGMVDDWTVARRALGQEGSRWLPVRRPDAYAADVFRTLARSHGIQLPAPEFDGRDAPENTTLAEVASVNLRSILRDMMKYSTNLTAEAVGLRASGAPTLEASAGEMSRWLRGRIGDGKVALVDHSGLGDRSRISAEEMVRMLVAVGPDGPLRGIMKTIPLKDAQGRPETETGVDVRAKTGTLNFVSALAGYARAPTGRDLAFAIFTADMDRRAAIDPEDRERPDGAKTWTARSRGLQQDLLHRWVSLYGG